MLIPPKSPVASNLTLSYQEKLEAEKLENARQAAIISQQGEVISRLEALITSHDVRISVVEENGGGSSTQNRKETGKLNMRKWTRPP